MVQICRSYVIAQRTRLTPTERARRSAKLEFHPPAHKARIFKARMTGPITRRDALLRTAALASAGMIPAAPLTGVAAPLNKPARSEEIDRALQATVSAR